MKYIKQKKITFLLIILNMIIIILSIIYASYAYILNAKNTNFTSESKTSNNKIYDHRTEETIINIYNYKTGKLRFKITASSIQHLKKKKITWIIHPKITIFNENNTTIWAITAKHANLIHCEKILNLHECIQINNLTNTTYLQSIQANHATINYLTQEITAIDNIIAQGKNIFSTGEKVHINLQTQMIEITKNTKTYYEIKQI